jgi:formate dehydrogenase major subunit
MPLRPMCARGLAWTGTKRPTMARETTLRAKITDRVAPGVVYRTFYHPATPANVVTGDYSDWATNCPEYQVTAV